MSTMPNRYAGPLGPPTAISSRFSSPLIEKCACILRAIFALINRSSSTQESSLRVEERLNLGPKKALLLVSCYGRHFLVATAGETIAPLIEVEPRDEKATRRISRKSISRSECAQ
jgi:flagellar biogenesis protein FliO